MAIRLLLVMLTVENACSIFDDLSVYKNDSNGYFSTTVVYGKIECTIK